MRRVSVVRSVKTASSPRTARSSSRSPRTPRAARTPRGPRRESIFVDALTAKSDPVKESIDRLFIVFDPIPADQRALTRALQSMATSEKHHVHGCSTVRDVLRIVQAKAASSQATVVVAEVAPRSTDAVGLMKNLKRDGFGGIPVLLCARGPRDQLTYTLRTCQEMGAVGVVDKPIDVAGTAQRVVRLAERFATVQDVFEKQIAERDFRLATATSEQDMSASVNTTSRSTQRKTKPEAKAPAGGKPGGSMADGSLAAIAARRSEWKALVASKAISLTTTDLTINRAIAFARASIAEDGGAAIAVTGLRSTWKELARTHDPNDLMLSSNLLHAPIKRPTLSLLPRHSRVRQLLNRCFERNAVGNVKEAWKDANAAVQNDSVNAESFLCRGILALLHGALAVAIEDFTSAFLTNQSAAGPIALYNRAQAFAALGELELAEHDLTKALTLGPPTAEVLALRADMARNLAMLKRATASRCGEASVDYENMYLNLSAAQQSAVGPAHSQAGSPRNKPGRRFSMPSSPDPVPTSKFSTHGSPARELGPENPGFRRGIGESRRAGPGEDAVSRRTREATTIAALPSMLNAITLNRVVQGQEESQGIAESQLHSVANLRANAAWQDEIDIIRKVIQFMSPEEVRQVDVNGDGKVTIDEFRARASLATRQLVHHIRRQPPEVRGALLTPPKSRTDTDIEALHFLMRTVPYFWSFTAEIQRDFCRALSYTVVDVGTYVCRQGESADQFYVILSGRLAVRVTNHNAIEETTVNMLKGGEWFGELGFVQRGGKRMASVLALEPTELLAIPFADFRESGLQGHFKKDMETKISQFMGTGAFEGWPPSAVAALAAVANVRSHPRGSVLVEQGAPASRFYVILTGAVRAIKRVDPVQELREKAVALEHQLEQLLDDYAYHSRLRPSIAAHRGSRESMKVLSADAPAPVVESSLVNSAVFVKASKRLARRSIASRRSGSASGRDMPSPGGARRWPSGGGSQSQQTLGRPDQVRRKHSASSLRRPSSRGSKSLAIGAQCASENNRTVRVRKAGRRLFEALAGTKDVEFLVDAYVADVPDRGDAIEHTKSKGEQRITELKAELQAVYSKIQVVTEDIKQTRRRQSAMSQPTLQLALGKLSSAASSNQSELPSVEVAMLYPPNVLGEAALLDPWKGREKATFTADTWVQTLSFSKTQVDHSLLTPALLKTLQRRAVIYPPDAKLQQKYDEGREWAERRREVVDAADKRLWPVRAEMIKPLPHGGSVIVEKQAVGPVWK